MTDLDSRLAELDPLAGTPVAGPGSPAGRETYRLLLTRIADVTAAEDRAAAAGASTRIAEVAAAQRRAAPQLPRRGRRVVVAVLAAALSIAVAVPAVMLSLRSPGDGHGATPATSTVMAHPPAPAPPPVSHRAWPTRVLASGLDIDVDTAVGVPGTPYVLGLAPQECFEPCASPLVRLDVATGQLLLGPVVLSYSGLDVAPGQALLLTATKYSAVAGPRGGWEVQTVDLATLHLGPPVKLPFGTAGGISYTQPLAAGSPDEWMSAGTGLVLVDTTTGRVVRRALPSVRISDLALSPDGEHLYAVCGTDVCELDPGTGRVLRETPQASPDGALGLVATDTMVWAFDLRGGVRVYRAAGLRVVDVRAALPPLTRPSQYTYGFTPTLLGDVLVLQTPAGTTCVDPGTGTLRAEATYAPSQTPPSIPLDAAGGHLFALDRDTSPGTRSNLVEVTPPPACFGP